MVHPTVDNGTPFVAETLFVSNEEGRPIAVPVLKATYSIGEDGGLDLAEEQAPLSITGEHWGEPGESSLRLEAEIAFVKEATDVVLLGHAHAPRPGCTEVRVVLSAGPIRKAVDVIGDRVWEKGLGGMRIGDPEPFERVPLVWERAFGGHDETPDRERHHDREARNPVGVGFHAKRSRLGAGSPLPNLEQPDRRIRRWSARPTPAGFGFLAPHWAPRAERAGTYDEAWERDRAPLLPVDFQRRFFNAAPDDQIVEGGLAADAEVEITHVSPSGRLAFRLPGLAPPSAIVATKRTGDVRLELAFDTLVIDADARRVTLLWRACTPLDDGPLDVRHVRIDCANAPARPGVVEEPASNVVPLFPSDDRQPAAGARGD